MTMAHRPIDVYLNDHLAGATFGADLAREIEASTEGLEFGSEMTRLASEIEEDLDTLTDLMDRLGVTRNPAKRVAGWVAEKASRLKLTGLTSTDDELGTFLSLEALSLGVEGKAALWTTLGEVRGNYPALMSSDLDELLRRAERQREALEVARIAIATRALTTEVTTEVDA